MVVLNAFYNACEIITDMLNEGYAIKNICINNEVYGGKLIKHIDFLSYVCIEFVFDEIMFVPYDKIDYIVLYDVDDDE